MQALSGQPITIYGEGDQTRSFCYVDDLVDGFIKLKESETDVTGPIILGNLSEFTIKDTPDIKSLFLTKRGFPSGLRAPESGPAEAGTPR